MDIVPISFQYQNQKQCVTSLYVIHNLFNYRNWKENWTVSGNKPLAWWHHFNMCVIRTCFPSSWLVLPLFRCFRSEPAGFRLWRAFSRCAWFARDWSIFSQNWSRTGEVSRLTSYRESTAEPTDQILQHVNKYHKSTRFFVSDALFTRTDTD